MNSLSINKSIYPNGCLIEEVKEGLLHAGVESIGNIDAQRLVVDEAAIGALTKCAEEHLKKSKSTKQRKVLVANCEDRVVQTKKLKTTISTVCSDRIETWQRFCEDVWDAANNNNKIGARSWPAVSERKCDYAFLRGCADKEALEFLLTAVVTRMKLGGCVCVSGARSEGFLNAFDSFDKVSEFLCSFFFFCV